MIAKNAVIPLCDLRKHFSFAGFKEVKQSATHKHILKTSVEVKVDTEKDSGASDGSQEVKKESKEESNNSYEEVKEKSEEEDDESYEVRKVGKRKTVKIFYGNQKVKKESEEGSNESNKEESNEDEDSDYDFEDDIRNRKERRIESKRKYQSKKENVSDVTIPKRSLSAYEQMIQKNREEKMAFLKSIKLDEAKFELCEAVKSVTKTAKPVKRKFVKKDSPPILRKSRRLANLRCVDFSEEALFLKSIETAEEEENMKKSMPSELSFKEALDNDELYENYVKDVKIEESKSETKFITYDKSDLKKMTVKESNVAKITPHRITAMAWYPSPEQLIIAAGDKKGNLGILNLDSESNPHLMKIHLEGISNLQFNTFNQVQLISSSYDGILRCGDMVQNKFDELYNASDTTCCTYFDFLSATTFLVSQKDGQVALVDRRARKCSEKKHDCHENCIKTVSVHPVNRSYFISADNKGSIRLWDLRKLQKNPVADLNYHKRVVHSAYFSPITGNSILATSADDSVSIFDSSNLTSNISLKQRMKHNNQTGRWLSVFRAKWLPNSEEDFVIGSMQFPRRIEVFDKNMFVYNMMHENFTTITSNNAFHPMRLALAGANSSGKVFVFT